MNNLFKKNQRGATTVLIAFFVMSAILMIAFSAAGIMIYEIKMSQTVANSVPAFYAADAGAEKCLYEARRLDEGSGGCSSIGGTTSISLSNGATVTATRKTVNKIESSGNYSDTKRSIETNWQ